MNAYISQPDKIVSWKQIIDVDTLIQFYTNCYHYTPELFIGAAVFAVTVGLYAAFNREKIMYQIRIAVLAYKMRNK